jgi:N-methylhydantoinase B
MVSKVTDVRVKAGERVRLETPGGGGFGHPAERDRDALQRDLRLGYVTPEAATRDYDLASGDEK